MRQTASQDDAVMLVLLATLAYAASMMTHEALGHGVYCLAAGGHNLMLTAWMESCSVSGGLGIKLAGPGVQFGAGLVAWLLLRHVPTNAIQLRYFVWLYMTFNVFISSSYVAFSGVTAIGDAAEYIAGRHPPVIWRVGLVLFGLLVYFFSMQAAATELTRLCGRDLSIERLFRLVWIPYVSAGCFACCTGALNRTMVPGAALGFAAASSFGSGSGMFGFPAMQRRFAPTKQLPTVYLEWSASWSAVATLILLAFLLFIGPGLNLT